MRSAFAVLVSAARFVTKSFLAFLLILICLFVGSLLLVVLANAVGLGDYKVWVLFVAWCLFSGVMMVRRVRRSQEPGGAIGPGSEAHTLGLRRKVQQELSHHRSEPRGPHP